MKLFDGTGFLIFKTHARVITCYLRGANRFRFSRQPGWRAWFPCMSAHFSELLEAPTYPDLSTTKARQVLTNWLRDRMIEQQFQAEMRAGEPDLLRSVIATARHVPRKVVLEDATGTELNYRRLLVGADLLGQQLRARLQREPERVGVLLPNVNATPVTLLALWTLGKVPAVLNFSTGPATMLACAELAGLKQIVTSRAFIQKARLNIDPLAKAGLDFVFLEDVRAGITGGAKLLTLLRVTLLPDSVASHPPLGTSTLGPEKAAAVLFTSGSEGTPKGVELSHRNILANIRQMLSVTDLEDSDRIFNALPLFHSFGLSVGALLGLVRGLYVFLYPSPLHYRIVPSALYAKNCSVFLSTNTFLNGYARKAHPYDFRSMRYLFAAAEKVQEATFQTWAREFGVRLLEGYGATECSPCVSVNTPLAPRYGSVGRIMPGMEFRLEPVEGVTEGGRLFVRGPNIMRGYLNPDADAKFKALDGWYDTGDIVHVDADGYFHILGRLKRFAKVSGEMVSLTAVEDALAGAFPNYGLRCQVAVVARPDAEKGEALIAVTNEPRLTLDEIRAAIKAKGLTNLCVPREIKAVREIPKLGTGKVNHRELQRLLIEGDLSSTLKPLQP
jgi:acyl-[acyl-carrier-protein]-phospholipid O-acyltransferase/long-chain-fatty-acid--[acyl-carrier-protein] ligase